MDARMTMEMHLPPVLIRESPSLKGGEHSRTIKMDGFREIIPDKLLNHLTGAIENMSRTSLYQGEAAAENQQPGFLEVTSSRSLDYPSPSLTLWSM